MRLLSAMADWLVALLDSATVRLHESTAAMEEREYWRGYTDGMQDTKEMQEASDG